MFYNGRILLSLVILSIAITVQAQPERLNSELIKFVKENRACNNVENGLALLRAIEVKLATSADNSAYNIESILFAQLVSDCRQIQSEGNICYNLITLDDACIDKIVDIFLRTEDDRVRKKAFNIFLSLYISNDCSGYNTDVLTRNGRHQKIYNWLLTTRATDMLNAGGAPPQCSGRTKWDILWSIVSPASILFFNYGLPYIERVSIMENCLHNHSYRLNPPFFSIYDVPIMLTLTWFPSVPELRKINSFVAENNNAYSIEFSRILLFNMIKPHFSTYYISPGVPLHTADMGDNTKSAIHFLNDMKTTSENFFLTWIKGNTQELISECHNLIDNTIYTQLTNEFNQIRGGRLHLNMWTSLAFMRYVTYANYKHTITYADYLTLFNRLKELWISQGYPANRDLDGLFIETITDFSNHPY